jgi:hypothetical protein
MRAMRRVVLASLLLAGCAGALGGPAPARAPGYSGKELRQPALTVHLAFGPGDFTKQERAELPEVYTTALLDALNAQAIVPVDVNVAAGTLDRKAAVARARDLGADQALIVDATVGRGLRTYCRNSRRMFTTRVTELVARVDVVRAGDGQTRLSEPEIGAIDFEEDCDAPKESRRLTGDELIAESVRKVLATALRGS